MLLPCSSSTFHGFFSAYIIAHSLTLLVVKLSWDHITLFLYRSPNPFPYCTSFSPFLLLIPFFMIVLSLCFPMPFPSQVLLPSPVDHFLVFYFSVGRESILCPNGSDYSSLFKFISMHLKSKYFLSPTSLPFHCIGLLPSYTSSFFMEYKFTPFFLFSHFS